MVSRVLLFGGLAAMLIGAADPLEGSVVILVGLVFAALGGMARKSRGRTLVYWGLVLGALGIGNMYLLSSVGGIGGHTGRSLLWGIVLLPYSIGWVLALMGVGMALVNEFRHGTSRKSAVN